jgi:hypothetical protein
MSWQSALHIQLGGSPGQQRPPMQDSPFSATPLQPPSSSFGCGHRQPTIVSTPHSRHTPNFLPPQISRRHTASGASPPPV